MNFLADESVDGQIVEKLRQENHDVVYIAELDPGITDDQVLEEANQREALLITTDKDFGELVFRLGRIHKGVILVRLGGLPPESKADVVADAVRRYEQSLDYSFSVISPGRIRIRPQIS